MIGELTLYSDGGCINNPGPGGCGVILQYQTENRTRSIELLQGYQRTTNNRMELMGVIMGLQKLNGHQPNVHVHTDSRYVVDAFEKKWVFGWEMKQFKNRTNADLWQRLLKIYRQHQVKFHWVRGHDANPRNERCDQLVTMAIKKGNLVADMGYINSNYGALNLSMEAR
ncbi:MAG: ribonuclease HI [Flavobacteriaceae bacterium]|nr:ribonuclease HI [Flavobacteriaceae bacterium]